MKKFLIYTLAFVLLVGLTVAGGFSLYKSSLFFLKTIRYEYVTDNNTTSYIETLKPTVEAPLAGYVGQSLWNVDIFKIESFLQHKSWVQNAFVSRSFPNELIIKIEPKKVVANILKSPSYVQPVAEDATVMDSVEISKSPGAPVLAHSDFLQDADLRKRALEFLKELPQDGSFSAQNISEIFPVKKNDSFRILLKKSKAEVLIDNENVPLKAARVSRVIDYMGDKEMEGRIIDANFSKKVLVRPRNHR